MQIILGKTAGFCFGVKNAVNKAEESLEENKEIYCLGELVHNKQVTEKLTNKGITFIENLEKATGTVIIRSHGASKEIYEQAKQRKLKVIDLTCPKVLKIHNIAQKYSDEGYYIFLIGKSNHPETIGTKSFCGEKLSIIENLEDTKKAINKFNKSNINKLLIISQTTYNLEEFEKIILKIKEEIKKEFITIKRTICEATKLRQQETEKISKEVELMIIIGGKHSSNSNKLYDISKENCKNVIFIETKKELKLDFAKKFEKIGIMAGASTPEKSIKEVVDILQEKC